MQPTTSTIYPTHTLALTSMARFLDQCVLFALAYLLRTYDFVRILLTQSARPHVPGVRVEHIRIPSRDPGRFIKGIQYTPEGASGVLPVYLSWQGSGWLLNRPGLDSHMNATFAKRLQCTVIDCDYRRGPEHKYPAGQLDCEDAMTYVLANPHKFDVDRISIGGSSAGACMALATCTQFAPHVKSAFALYTPTKMLPLDRIEEKKAPNAHFHSGAVLAPWLMRLFMLGYNDSGDAALKEPRFNPYYADVSGFPAYMLLACGDADTLYGDSVEFCDKIQKQGSPEQRAHTKLLTVPDEAHEFNLFPKTEHSRIWRDKVYEAAIAMIRASWTG